VLLHDERMAASIGSAFLHVQLILAAAAVAAARRFRGASRTSVSETFQELLRWKKAPAAARLPRQRSGRQTPPVAIELFSELAIVGGEKAKHTVGVGLT